MVWVVAGVGALLVAMWMDIVIVGFVLVSVALLIWPDGVCVGVRLWGLLFLGFVGFGFIVFFIWFLVWFGELFGLGERGLVFQINLGLFDFYVFFYLLMGWVVLVLFIVFVIWVYFWVSLVIILLVVVYHFIMVIFDDFGVCYILLVLVSIVFVVGVGVQVMGRWGWVAVLVFLGLVMY